jgi:hypothetical protein
MTELGFLIELLLNHELSKPTKDLIASRIREVEVKIKDDYPVYTGSINNPNFGARPPAVQQAPSTIAAMIKHGDLPDNIKVTPKEHLQPVAIIAQTPAAMAGLEHRNKAISDALSGKVDKKLGHAPKW